MKIGLRGGHSPNCKGAIGILDEQAEVRKIYNEMVPMLQKAGHTVIDCNSNSSSVNGELSEGTNKANAAGCDVYITVHMNASNGAGNGTECWMYNNANATMNAIADRINANFSAKGFQNRGKKYSVGLHDLNASTMPAMIVETLFCDNQHDADLYKQLGTKEIAKLIAEGITGSTVSGVEAEKPSAPSKPAPSTSDITPGVNFTYQVYTDNDGWLPAVTNLNDYAGVRGHWIRNVAIKVDKGSVKYRVHVRGAGWLPYVTGYNTADHNNGYAGNGQPIDAIEVYYNTPADYAAQYGYQKAQYRVSAVNKDYWPWQYDNETGNGQDGYAGAFGQPIDRFQLF